MVIDDGDQLEELIGDRRAAVSRKSHKKQQQNRLKTGEQKTNHLMHFGEWKDSLLVTLVANSQVLREFTGS